MSIYLDEKNPGKHKPFDDAAPDIVEYVRYLEVIAGKSANTAFSYYCDLRGFSRFMKRRRGLVPEDSEMKDIDPKGLDTAFWASVTKEDIYEYLYFLNRECDQLPLLAAGSEVLWVCGAGFAEGLAPDADTAQVLQMEMEHREEIT